MSAKGDPPAKGKAYPKKFFPRLAYNQISVLGAILALISGLTLLVLLAMSLAAKGNSNPYYGIFMYMVLPPFLIVGLLLIPLGMFRQWRHWRREGELAIPKWPYIDLNRHSHRNAAFVFLVGTIVVMAISAVGSYGAYHYSESVTFCGTTCHQVMKPEYTTYQNSPHARVPCTSCHVGPGADWYVKSKLSGSYQVYAVLADKFPRPIPTPIESLRPAQETCEQCHWPERIFGAQQKELHHYMYDDENTHWPIDMLIKTGGGDPSSGQTAGIHWHMNIGVKVEYIPRDEKRQDIPWIRVTDRRTGRVTVYQDTEKPLTKEEIDNAQPRHMDCMDCHNRPSHIYNSPDHAIDLAILQRKIDASIPAIKRISVEAMSKKYKTTPEAMKGIAGYITDAYRKDFADYYNQHSALVDAATVAVQNAYQENIFPEMNAEWSAYPNNIGHFNNVGCFRCHDGNHKSEDGVVVTHNCTACHVILSEGSGDRRKVAEGDKGVPFEHPEDIGGMWQETGCYECHTGVQP